MDRNRFANLIVGYCEHCGIKNPMDIVHGAPITVDDVLFSLVHSDPVDPRLILLVADAGDLPQRDDGAAFYPLLLQNFASAARRGPVFSISPDSGRLLLIQSEELDSLTPVLLAQRLEELAGQVRQWNEPSSDDEPETEAESAPASPRHTSHAISALHRRLLHR
jgi:hypothetical protein